MTRSRPAKLYLLLLVALLSGLNNYDHYIISILVEDLKRALALSDGQIGALSGLAFALVFATAAIPVARLADRGRHVRVLGVSALVWSVMSIACGMANGFWSFFLARIGVGLGESGAAPASQGLIGREFSPRWRGSAFAILGISVSIGVFAALAGGGAIAHFYGWRAAFYAGGIPGIVLGSLLLLTVRDRPLADAGMAPPSIGLVEAFRVLARRRAFVWTIVGTTICAIGANGAITWMPAFLMRQFGLNAMQVGTSFSASTAPGMLIGTVVGGLLNDWVARRDARAPFFLLAFSFAISAPLQVVMLLSNDYAFTLGLNFPSAILSMLWATPAFVAVQALCGGRLGATGAAIFALAVNLFGQGLGPSLVGSLSDLLGPALGKDSLRYALIIALGTYPIGVVAFLIAARTARADMAEAAE